MQCIAKGLQILGALSLAVILVAVGVLGYSVATNGNRINVATKDGVQFVFNWSGLKSNQEYKVLSSFESTRSLTGDHLDYYCIQISDFSPNDNNKENWQPVSSLLNPIKEAAHEAQQVGNASQCFGREIANPDNFLAYVWSATLHSKRITGLNVIFFDPQTKRLLYVGYKT